MSKLKSVKTVKEVIEEAKRSFRERRADSFCSDKKKQRREERQKKKREKHLESTQSYQVGDLFVPKGQKPNDKNVIEIIKVEDAEEHRAIVFDGAFAVKCLCDGHVYRTSMAGWRKLKKRERKELRGEIAARNLGIL